MLNQSIVITKELGILLAEIRKKAQLTQKEVAERLGFLGNSGRVYVSRLENGGINNPSLWLILQYLNVCEKSWSAFFGNLAGKYFNKQHVKTIAQVPFTTFHKKIDRDVAKYEHGIDSKFSVKQEVKPLPQEQKEKMAKDFGRYRANIEPIEREITLLLGNSGELPLLNQFYKAFVRECYSILKKSEPQSTQSSQEKDSVDSVFPAVNQKLNEVIEKWVKKGLKREILEQVKEITIKNLPQSHRDTENE